MRSRRERANAGVNVYIIPFLRRLMCYGFLSFWGEGSVKDWIINVYVKGWGMTGEGYPSIVFQLKQLNEEYAD